VLVKLVCYIQYILSPTLICLVVTGYLQVSGLYCMPLLYVLLLSVYLLACKVVSSLPGHNEGNANFKSLDSEHHYEGRSA
jgi:hypothetical protein